MEVGSALNLHAKGTNPITHWVKGGPRTRSDSTPIFIYVHHSNSFPNKFLLLHRAFWRLVIYYTPTNALLCYNSLKLFTFIHSFSILSDDRSKASSKTMPPHSAIQSSLLQMRVSSPVLKVIQ